VPQVSTRSSARHAVTSAARSSAAITASTSASTAALRMPAKFWLPGVSATALDHMLRCSLPGDGDWPQRWVIMS
jgi:hypothetical protein